MICQKKNTNGLRRIIRTQMQILLSEQLQTAYIPYDKVIEEVTELLENEWGYEGMKDDVARIMEGGVDCLDEDAKQACDV